ncbi:DUF6402 family protein, partial [Helicobacter sp. T3_23-1059]
KDTLRLQIIDSVNNPISDAEVRIVAFDNQTRYEVYLNNKTDINGIVQFNRLEKFKKNTQKFEVFIQHKDFYSKPIYNHRIICRSYEYGLLCKIKFKNKKANFAVQKIEIEPSIIQIKESKSKFVKNFYKPSDRIYLKAIYDKDKVKPNEIKWGYEIIEVNYKNTATNPNYILFSNTQGYVPTDISYIKHINEPIYSANETLTLLQTDSIGFEIPQDWNNKKIAIFAYKHKPNWEVCVIISVGSYPQIVIDGTHAETLRADKDIQDSYKESTILGWGVSYLLQRLWHDNPKKPISFKHIHRANDGLRYKSSKEIIVDDDNLQKILSNIDEIKLTKLDYKQHNNDLIEYYAELDWDNLYLKFPMIKDLESEILGVKQADNTYIQDNVAHIITENFKNKIKDFLQSPAQIQQINNSFVDYDTQDKIFVVAIILDKIQEREQKPKDGFKFQNCAMLIPADIDIIKNSKKEFIYHNQRLKLLTDCKPHEFSKLQLQYYSIEDEMFAQYMGMDIKGENNITKNWKGLKIIMKNEQEINQIFNSSLYAKSTIALYAITGKFSIYYLPSKITIKKNKQQNNILSCFIDELLCYIYDSFDFSDEPYQPVGMWDYNEIAFNQYESMQHLGTYKFYKDLPHFPTNKLASMDIKRMEQEKHNLYYIINQDYQNYQNDFKFGLDYRIFSNSAKTVKVKHNNSITLKVEVS